MRVKEADEYQTDLLVANMNFRENTKPRSREKQKQKKEIVLKNLHKFFECRERVIKPFESKIF